MPNSAIDFTAARMLMVNGQVRPNKVTDTRVLDAMRRLPRELFVPADRAALAYCDEDVPLGNGRYLVEPMVIARMVQIAAVQDGDRALVVGSGSGYGAALLAACGAAVTALEQDTALIALARAVLPVVCAGITLVAGITMVEGPLADGWNATGPYDVILIEGAVPEIPPALLAQLRSDGGRLVTVLKRGARVGQAVLCRSAGGGRVDPHPVFDCAIPVLPMLKTAPGFVF